MNQSEKRLDELYRHRDEVEELIKYAKLLGNKVALGDEIVSIERLQDILEEIKFEIAARTSQNNLRIIKS